MPQPSLTEEENLDRSSGCDDFFAPGLSNQDYRHRGFLMIAGRLQGKRPPEDLQSLMMQHLDKGIWNDGHLACKFAEGTYLSVSGSPMPTLAIFIERAIHLPEMIQDAPPEQQVPMEKYVSTLDAVYASVQHWLQQHMFHFVPTMIRTTAFRADELETG